MVFEQFWSEMGIEFHDFGLTVIKWAWVLQKRAWILETRGELHEI